ncbi:MAG: carboxylate--amine ligase, partial [Methanobacterium sp.]
MQTNYERLELSTQIVIKEALKRGVEVEVLDPDDNFIRLKKGNNVEYVKQATKTSVDTYIAPLIMENKEITKLVLN